MNMNTVYMNMTRHNPSISAGWYSDPVLTLVHATDFLSAISHCLLCWQFDWSSACLIAPVVTTTAIILSCNVVFYSAGCCTDAGLVRLLQVLLTLMTSTDLTLTCAVMDAPDDGGPSCTWLQLLQFHCFHQLSFTVSQTSDVMFYNTNAQLLNIWNVPTAT